MCVRVCVCVHVCACVCVCVCMCVCAIEAVHIRSYCTQWTSCTIDVAKHHTSVPETRNNIHIWLSAVLMLVPSLPVVGITISSLLLFMYVFVVILYVFEKNVIIII